MNTDNEIPTLPARGDPPDWIDDLFDAIDGRDALAFAGFLHPEAEFRFGNSEPVRGRGAIRDAVQAFFDQVAGLGHRVDAVWTAPDVVICHGEVTYVRKDESTVTLPFADIFEMRDDKISKYLIYMDIGPLFAAG